MGMLGGGSRLKLLLGLIWLLSLCNGAWAVESCRAVFSGGLQTHGSIGSVTFQWGAQLLANPSAFIDTARVQANPWSVATCGSSNCKASGQVAANLGPLVLPSLATEHDLRLTYMASGEAGGDALNSYRHIDVDAGADLSFSTRHQTYYIQRLSIGYGARVTLAPGRYWIGRLDIASSGQLQVSGGSARVMVGSGFELPFQARLNAAENGAGNPDKLQLIVNGGINQGSASLVNAVAYLEGDYRSEFAAHWRGALSARSIDIGTLAKVETVPAAIGALSWNNQCEERADLDGDGILDLFDSDTDGDGVDDENERLAGSDPRDAQSIPATPAPSGYTSLCVAAFTRGLQAFGEEGRIDFGYNAQLRGGTSFYLPAMRVNSHVGSSLRSCDAQHCQPSFDTVEVPTLPAYRKTTSSFTQTVPAKRSLEFDGSRQEWHRLSLAAGARVRFSQPGEYRLSKVSLAHRAVLELAPGDYWIESLDLGSEARLQPIGNGTVRLHLLNNLQSPWQALLNADGYEQPGNPSKLLIFARGNVTLGASTTTAAYIYARGKLNQEYASLLYGGAVAKGIRLDTMARTHQNLADLPATDFAALCDLDDDGIGDNLDADRDGDGIANDYEEQVGTDPDDAASVPADQDNDGIPDSLDDDRDGDGVANDEDAFPDDASESKDLDGDGIGDNADPDRDGDGISNDYETQLGTDPDDNTSTPADQDKDGIPDSLDDDRDGDGVANDQDVFPDDASESKDLDGDGIGDNADPDRDGDGISNDYEEQVGTDPNAAGSVPADQDGDGIPDVLDLDRDGDGVPNDLDAFPDDSTEFRDQDGDGIGDNADPDRDGDGISNDYETQVGTDPNDAGSTPPDQDKDGIPDSLDDDRDGDGVANDQDAFPDDASESKDQDGDGIGDNADPDRDGDGISNDYETQVGTDPDDNTSTPPDQDGDAIPDSLDDDRDGDGVANDEDAFPDDASESKDQDGDGIGDNADPDRDGDGISNDYETQVGTDPDDNTSTPADQDGDGIPDSLDDDRDGDGVTNDQDAFPDDASESKDQDGDGIGDNADPDRDGDGISNDYETQVGTDPDDNTSTPADQDGDGIPDSLDDDRDGDGVPNDRDVFPDDASESKDLDGDGIGDNADPDRDGDGISNDYEGQVGTDPDDNTSTPPDQDGDGIPNSVDDDRDGDGVFNPDDAFPDDPSESKDLDGDGIGDNSDPDRDGDGISNDYEVQLGTDPSDPHSTPADQDKDGIPDSLDDDRDGDGVANDQDALPDDPTESKDLDGDGIGDNADPDRDGDGISNDYEEQVGTDPNDSASTPADQDKDGIPDSLDDDRDGDGVANDQDAFPDEASESKDLDGDGVGDNADPDRDGDGISNEHEEQLGTNPDDAGSKPADQDSDGLPDSLDDDRDGDGVANDQDAFPDEASESKDLDGDGIGDNADTDRDGDGASNADEVAAGTDPDDASDFPDRVAPDVGIDGPDFLSVNEDSLNLSGSVSDSGSGVDRLEFASDRFPGARFAVSVQAAQWTASVPLLEGSNLLTLTAFDKAGNAAQLTRNVERQPLASDIGLRIDYPQSGAVLTEATLVVRGLLRSDQPAQRLEVLVNGQAATLSPTAQVTEFNFQSTALNLQPGPNTLSIQGWVEQRSVQRSVLVTYQPPQTSFAAPRFDNLSPANGSLLPGASFVLSGQVFAEGGLQRVTLNGRSLTLREPGAQLLDLRESLTIPDGQSTFGAELIARDNSGQETRQSLSWQLDRQAPQIILDTPLLELPAQNRVSEQPYPITGTVRENNLASFQLNGQDVALQPGAQAGEFRFASQVGLPLGQPVSLTLEARDQAGNRLRREYSLELSGQAAINWVLPTEGSELLNLGEPINLQVAARIEDLSGQLVPRVFLLSSTGDSLAEAGLLGDTTLKSATLQIPPQSGQYRLLAVLQDGNQQVVAQSSRSIAVVTQEQVPIAIERISPSNAARNVDPNDFITLYFNQAIDPAKLELKVFESANGKTYVDMDPLGVNPLEAKGYQLVDVNRSYEPVPGELSLLPGNQVVAFYPARDVAYAAEVSVEVRYDGQELQRIRYQTRALPTLISGAVFDQLQQPVPDLEVRLVELGRSTRTNRDGAFNFGFGDAAQENIAGGNYRLELNPGQANRNYGSERKAVAIQGGRNNELGRFQLAQLNSNLPYSVLQGGQTFSLLQGELKLDLTRASLQFPDGTQSGDVHAQLLEFSQLPYPVEPLAMPYWMYGLQPGGIAVEGEVGVDLAALKLGDSYDYLPDNDDYVVLVGLDPQARRIVPVGVGQVSNYRVHSRGALALQTLDLIGFALVGGEAQPALKAYAEGQLNLRQLHSELNRLNNSQ